MKITLSFEMRQNYMFVKATGVFSVQDAIDTIPKALATADSFGATRILVDCLELTGAPSVADYYQYSKSVAAEFLKTSRISMKKVYRAAYVAKPPIFDEHLFIELVALNRGATVKLFENTTDAIAWLESQGS